ncbi:phosphoglycerate mutase-like protein 1 isoform X2 [Citrus clementina]|uniref:phosphoglycerate mutase-like protein 1 isoform X2 n=1 Tax=Citrus clementina TaxID=85681 RepID=UPI000CECEA54|nr:phosphoglycerate mutase-like protein 1 isoform X2 [Citrus x clementina]
MVTAQAQFLYSPNNCKILHMVRHGQGVHNVEAEKNIDALLSPELFDSPISALGWQQVADLRKYVHATGLLKRIDLVVTSPLLRTMQTAVGVFGSEGADAGFNSNCPPIVAHELCRDRLGLRPCDQRRSVSECRSLFPEIDFSLASMESEEDDMWYPEAREPYEDIEARGIEFLKWLWTRPEKEIAIVSHGVVLQHFLYVLENDSADPSVKTGLCRRFNNCELRSVVVVNKGMMDSDYISSATN